MHPHAEQRVALPIIVPELGDRVVEVRYEL